MFVHTQDLQFEAKPEAPDAEYANRLQEVLGGKWGEMTVAMQYLYQGWNCRLPGKYKDLLLSTGTEELAHVEMLCTMIARLLESAPLSAQEAAQQDNPMLAAVFGGSNPQHSIVNGGGGYPYDSNGVPWSAAFITSSGNLLADFHLNATAEMQGRLQVARLYNMTDDRGVKDLLKFLLARDHLHQMQWLAAVEELESDGLGGIPVPEAFPVEEQHQEYANKVIKFSDGNAIGEGRWASGQAADGRTRFELADRPEAHGERPVLPPGDPRLYGTPPQTATTGAHSTV
ncbi:manganese catalase [Goodfellowiella coeruleoviolacea]|uniref:Mn-containing catalase n=1 Tax=Goodfellowiella coeruleoviolacea TaxID=334858 RepID=A0AAE3GFQ0_9PSEU|nr:manganese catalase family protein [Goodfellowiella coeruleoviolacea]MCP2166484.1 Mn-containing catalase [Goodfellowiella coeruleoviolacea]